MTDTRIQSLHMRPSHLRRIVLGLLLLLPFACTADERPEAGHGSVAAPPAVTTRPATRPVVPDPSFTINLRDTVAYLASEELEGRLIGTPGIDKAADFIGECFAKLGLQTPDKLGGYYQSFTVTTSTTVDPKTNLNPGKGKDWAAGEPLKVKDDFQPLSFSTEAEFDAPVAFVGYGISDVEQSNPHAAGPANPHATTKPANPHAPADPHGAARPATLPAGDPHAALVPDPHAALVGDPHATTRPATHPSDARVLPPTGYDDYAGIDVKGKVVIAMRFDPQDANGVSRFTFKKDEWSDHAAIPVKAKLAAAKGAVALLLVNPPLHHEGDAYTPFNRSMQFDKAPIPVIQIKQPLADALLKAGGLGDLRAMQAKIDQGEKPASAALADVNARGAVVFKRTQKPVRNVVGILPGSGPNAHEYVVIGAHYDHLGRGGPGSLAPLSKAIHHGADDNASGTSAMLKIAEHYSRESRAGRAPPRTLVFVAFTGEEEGLLGSSHFVNNPPITLDKTVAMLNLDMVGRIRDNKLSVGGDGTAPSFEKILEAAKKDLPLVVKSMGKGGMGPSDHTSFSTKRIPVIFFFSGTHPDYHRPTDVASKINYEGLEQVVKLSIGTVDGMARMPKEQYVAAFDSRGMGRATGSASGGIRVTLGIVPDYTEDDFKGVRISGTTPGSPADKAGLQGGDAIVAWNGEQLSGLMDLTQRLQKGKPGDKVKLKVLRGEKTIETEATLVERK